MINFRPKMRTISLELKCQLVFESIDELKRFISEQATIHSRFRGDVNRFFRPDDVHLEATQDVLIGWKNFRRIILSGRTIGYCGEVSA